MLHMASCRGRHGARWGQATAWAAAEAEQRRVLAERGPGIDLDALGDMDALQRCVTEALRLFPPLIMLLRQAKAAFAVETSAGRRLGVPRARPCRAALACATSSRAAGHAAASGHAQTLVVQTWPSAMVIEGALL